MTTPKEALEQAVSFARQVACIEGVRRAPEMKAIAEQYQALFEQALASLQGEDAVERVALAWAKARDEWMRASRHGTQEEADKAAVAAILATGLVPDEAAVRADEREKCAKVADSKQRSVRQFSVAADIAAAIRSGGGE